MKPVSSSHRRLGVERIGQAGNRVGETWRCVHADARLLGEAAPGIGHLHRGLLMARVDDAKILVCRHVKQG